MIESFVAVLKSFKVKCVFADWPHSFHPRYICHDLASWYDDGEDPEMYMF